MQKTVDPIKRRTALGQGLNALLPLEEAKAESSPDPRVTYLPIESLLPSPYQPRRSFTEDSLAELSKSIKEMGVIQPLIVRRVLDRGYEIVAGERRWRAARMAGFSTIPAIVRDLTDSESLEIALIENIQRENLNPLDTAEAYEVLIEKFSYTHELLAQRIGKDRTSITNHLRLLKLPDPIKQDLRADKLSMGHARTLLAIEDLPTQLLLCRKTIGRKWSVRELEQIVQNYRKKQQGGSLPLPEKDPDLAALENRLSRHLSTRVSIRKTSNESGRLELYFHSGEELERLLETLGYTEDIS
jgi:ParB family transcriptional regulator, chromosome partitioning protein